MLSAIARLLVGSDYRKKLADIDILRKKWDKNLVKKIIQQA